MDSIEILGIVSTIFVLISFLMKDVVKIRIINIIGALLFVIYGILLGAWSVWILNLLLIIIHMYYLSRIALTTKRDAIPTNR